MANHFRVSKDPKVFEAAFQKRLGQSPTDYPVRKIQSGSSVSSIERLFDMVSAEISAKNYLNAKALPTIIRRHRKGYMP